MARRSTIRRAAGALRSWVRRYGPDMSTPEAEIEETEHGRKPATPGWYVINLADAVGVRNERSRASGPTSSLPRASRTTGSASTS